MMTRVKRINSHIKTLSLAFAFIFTVANFIPSTFAFYNTEEVSSNNTLQSSSLDLQITQTEVGPAIADLAIAGSYTFGLDFANVGRLAFAYNQGYYSPSTDQTFCNILNLSVEEESTVVYSGLLKDYALNLDGSLANMNLEFGESANYSYTISIPVEEDPENYINKTCSLEIRSQAWMPSVGLPGKGFWDSEYYSLLIKAPQVACSEMSGIKKNSQTGDALADWQIIIHDADKAPLEELAVDSSNPLAVSTANILETGKKYLIEASGTWQDGTSKAVDADYWSEDSWLNHDDFDTHPNRDSRQLDLLINGADVDWQSYNSAHTYLNIYEGGNALLNFVIYDADNDEDPPSWYSDNKGSLIIRIFEVDDEIVTTGADGRFSKTICDIGNYQVLEILKDGWEQEAPFEPSYYSAQLPLSEASNFEFSNKELGFGYGDVIINEVMWMGSFNDPNDEWIELKNTTDSNIDLSGCIIENAAQGFGDIIFPAGSIIGAQSYFLITNYAKESTHSDLNVDGDWITSTLSLNNGYNGSLVLSCNSLAVDYARNENPSPQWPAGDIEDHGRRRSMERNNTPGNGLDASSWHTCEDTAALTLPAWDQTNSWNYGTPGSLNLSENDPTLPLEGSEGDVITGEEAVLPQEETLTDNQQEEDDPNTDPEDTDVLNSGNEEATSSAQLAD